VLILVETAQAGGEGFGRDAGRVRDGRVRLAEHVAQHHDVAARLWSATRAARLTVRPE
jgi:hypothetical protein